MKAVVYKEKGVFSLEEREVPMIKDPGGCCCPGDIMFHMLQRYSY